MSKTEAKAADVIVVGGGLAGLTAAAVAAKAGKSVAVFEKARELGGRAATQREGDFLFNMGPHALYRGSAAAPILAELGVTYTGKTPTGSGAFAISGGAKHALPGGLVSLITTSLLRLPAKLEVGRLLGSIGSIDADRYQKRTVNEWLAETVRHEEVRQLLRGLVRVSTYTNDPDRMSAGTAIRQIQGALGKGVTYLDGGWQTMIEGLRKVAQAAGAQIVSGAKVESIEGGDRARGVRLASGDIWNAQAVVLTGSPAEISALVNGGAHLPLRRWVDEAVPVHAACLDIGLSRLPRPKATFALGIDQPLYLSVHSASAKLAPENAAMIHVAKYLPSGDRTDAKAIERELEALLDLVQPGWREVVLERRFLPHMVVTHLLPMATAGGLAGRPSVEVPGIANLFIAGDWVGAVGMLADASVASGKRAAQLAAEARTSSLAA